MRRGEARRGEASPPISSEVWRIQKDVPWQSKGDWRRDVISQVATPRDLRDLRESRHCYSSTTYATVVQYDYAALFFKPLYLVVDWW
uniref:Uncharacterized protein n=1 Tax=Solanum tuberosum TaxID=4113 RepID=M1E0Z5_SOLTU